MNTFDIILLTFACVLVVVGMFKGLVRILLGLAALVAAFALAARFHEGLADRLSGADISIEALRLVAYLLIFVGVMLAGGLVAFFARKLLKAAMLGWADRLGGAALGFAVAMLAAALVVLPVVAYSPYGEPVLARSILAPYIIVVAEMATSLVPEDLSLRYKEKVEDLRRYWQQRYIEDLNPDSRKVWVRPSQESFVTEQPSLPVETYSQDERRALSPYFTNLDGPVFALVNLPEVVKGALFARYSRSPKSLRRLFLDEFLDEVEAGGVRDTVGVERAEKLYDKVFLEYGDDSVAQLGGVHLACENVSNILTKILEWGRLMAYLEQSTRYVPYTDRPGGHWKYHVPAELYDSPLRGDFVSCLDDAFATYAKWFDSMQDHFGRKYPREDGVSAGVYKRTLRAKALDAVRGLLPAATLANVGIYGTGQAYEALLLRMRANPLLEVQACADSMLGELRKVIPAFLRRVDLPDRGGRWSRYLQESRDDVERVVREALGEVSVEAQPEVVLSDFDPDGEIKVVAAAMYAVTNLPDVELQRQARSMSHERRLAVLKAYVGDRTNRRHKPGRAFERTSYRFDILGDYGAFRDLQRHRMLTLEWQRLSTDHGYTVAEAIGEAGGADDWTRAMDRAVEVHDALCGAGMPLVASYVVPMAYRVRFYMEMNAREAMHTVELRTTPQGHPSYRRVCQTMHRLIAEQAGHRAIAEAIRFADHSAVELERLEAERAAERRRGGG